MNATATPSPFDPAGGFTIQVTGGTPPYEFIPLPSPPNPPGVSATPTGGGTADVQVSPAPPGNTPVLVECRDSSSPPQTARVNNKTRP